MYARRDTNTQTSSAQYTVPATVSLALSLTLSLCRSLSVSLSSSLSLCLCTAAGGRASFREMTEDAGERERDYKRCFLLPAAQGRGAAPVIIRSAALSYKAVKDDEMPPELTKKKHQQQQQEQRQQPGRRSHRRRLEGIIPSPLHLLRAEGFVCFVYYLPSEFLSLCLFVCV